MLRKTAARRYFTTGDIADYTGLTQGQISKTAIDPNSWLALFVVCAGKGERCRFVDPTGWLLELWCGFKRVKRFFPSATRDQVFKALRIIGLEKGELRPRSLTQRYAAELNPNQERIYRTLSAPKPKRIVAILGSKRHNLARTSRRIRGKPEQVTGAPRRHPLLVRRNKRMTAREAKRRARG
jgi:hypothetical protein